MVVGQENHIPADVERLAFEFDSNCFPASSRQTFASITRRHHLEEHDFHLTVVNQTGQEEPIIQPFAAKGPIPQAGFSLLPDSSRQSSSRREVPPLSAPPNRLRSQCPTAPMHAPPAMAIAVR